MRRGIGVGAAVAAALLGAAGAGAAQAPPRLDVVHYDAALRVDPGDRSVEGTVRIRLAAAGGALGSVVLAARGIEVERASVGGTLVTVAVAADSLRVPLPVPLAAGDTAEVEIAYRARPERGVRFGESAVFTVFHTYEWLPCHFAPGDRATLSLDLELPEGLEVVAAGEPVGREPGAPGTTRHRWRLDEPFPAYLFAFAAGDLESVVHPGPPLLGFHADSLSAAELERALGPTADMLAFYEERSGVPFPGRRYDQALLPGAPPQEAATFSILSLRYARALLADPTEDYLVAHELAHQWWGNRVTAADWRHFWLHEGTVTFLVAAWKERRWGRAAYDREMELARRRYARTVAEGTARPLVGRDPLDHASAGGPVPYNLGALFLHRLREELGEEAFWAGLRAFTRRGVAAGSVTTDDLRRALEEASGRDLAPLFERWTRGAVVEM